MYELAKSFENKKNLTVAYKEFLDILAKKTLEILRNGFLLMLIEAFSMKAMVSIVWYLPSTNRIGRERLSWQRSGDDD